MGGDFHDGLALSCLAGLCGYLDTTGSISIPRQFEADSLMMMRSFSDGMAAMFVDEKWGYIDRSGKFFIKPQFERAGNFSEGLASVEIGGKSGYIDKSGRFVIPPNFDLGRAFSEGLAAVNVGFQENDREDGESNGKPGKWGFINRQGKFVIPSRFDAVDDFHCSTAAARVGDDKIGVIDRSGRWVVPPSSEERPEFSNDRALVEKDGKWGYIDRGGKLVIDYQFTAANDFDGGLARVEIGKTEAYIDTSGKFIWKFPSDQYPMKNGDAEVEAWSVGHVEVKLKFTNVWTEDIVLPNCGKENEGYVCGEFVRLEQQTDSGWHALKLNPSCFCGIASGYFLREQRVRLTPGEETSTKYSFEPQKYQLDNGEPLQKGKPFRAIVYAFSAHLAPAKFAISPEGTKKADRIIVSDEFKLPDAPW